MRNFHLAQLQPLLFATLRRTPYPTSTRQIMSSNEDEAPAPKRRKQAPGSRHVTARTSRRTNPARQSRPPHRPTNPRAATAAQLFDEPTPPPSGHADARTPTPPPMAAQQNTAPPEDRDSIFLRLCPDAIPVSESDGGAGKLQSYFEWVKDGYPGFLNIRDMPPEWLRICPDGSLPPEAFWHFPKWEELRAEKEARRIRRQEKSKATGSEGSGVEHAAVHHNTPIEEINDEEGKLLARISRSLPVSQSPELQGYKELAHDEERELPMKGQESCGPTTPISTQNKFQPSQDIDMGYGDFF
ncbi:hypothetical protein FPV67DRAFT_1672174 [Lyophyllum atratum]|nr:hypothetical protein FPV67DRAFT_1672174 [Lyophyllum atratum]